MISKEPLVSILILTKNGENTIGECLEGLFKQSFRDFEILVIDSDSADETLQIASQYPVRIVRITEAEFHHAKTRNLAVSLSKGRFVVFIVQDAFPANEKWLKELLRPFKNKRVAATYSRQESRKDTSPVERAFTEFTYPRNIDEIVLKRKGEKDPSNFVLLSDVSSAFRKEIAFFDTSIGFCEDQEIASRLIDSGYEIAYVPNSVVVHSHNYNIINLFKRYQSVGNPAGRFAKNGYSLSSSGKFATRLFASTFSYIISNQGVNFRIFWLIYSIPYNAIKIFSFVVGYLKNKSAINKPIK